MDSERFDQIVRTLRAGANRRRVLQGIGGVALTGLLGPARSEAKDRGRRRGMPRTKNASASRSPAVRLKVMTRNLYLGADLSPLFTVASEEELVATAAEVFARVEATDFPARAKLLAEEIEDTEPHLVGLQEVSLWRTETPSDGGSPPDAQDVAFDFLALLLREIGKQGGRYEAVVTSENFDAEVPMETRTGLQDVRLTDYDVILARTDLPARDFAISNPQAENFDTNLTIPNPLLGNPIVRRGWAAVDVALRGQSLRFVNTHLEPFAPPVQEAQGDELLAGPLNTPLPVVLVGDLNSAADGNGTPGQTDTETYRNLLEAGFVDAWRDRRNQRAGFTCCQAEDLLNEESTLSERIDFVLTRGDFASAKAIRIGADPDERTKSDLWPSDHAGVVANLRLRRS